MIAEELLLERAGRSRIMLLLFNLILLLSFRRLLVIPFFLFLLRPVFLLHVLLNCRLFLVLVLGPSIILEVVLLEEGLLAYYVKF